MRKQKTIAAAAMAAALAGGTLIGATLGNPLASGAESGAGATTTTTAANGTTAPGQTGTAPDKGGDHRGPGGFRGGMGMDLDTAAKALNMTTEQLQTQLKAGKSLADVAKAQGVDKQKVIDALVAAGNARLDKEKAALPDQVAKIVDGTLPAGAFGGPGGFRGGPGGFGRGGFGFGPSLDVAAKAIGISEDDLRTALEGGKTIAQVAKDKGVDQQKVIDALVADAKAKTAAAVKDKKMTQAQADKVNAAATDRITKFVTEGRPKGDHDGPPPGGGGH
ncbi:hypothetical protein [Aquihabitans sp. McL0605]|uniref:hypothetical protein n=1 Tax=Aquihabitans sp. McL0605 TaxID=3415671 RepID=UPI003CF5A419